MSTEITCKVDPTTKKATITIIVDPADFFANNPNEFRKQLGQRSYKKLTEIFMEIVDGRTTKHTRYEDLFPTSKREHGTLPLVLGADDVHRDEGVQRLSPDQGIHAVKIQQRPGRIPVIITTRNRNRRKE